MTGYGKTPLIYAIEYRTYLTDSSEIDLICLLISKGADINHIDMSGLTPLFYAIYRGIPSIVEILLEHRADYKYENILGYSPFRYALGCLAYANPDEEENYFDRLKIVRILLEKFQFDPFELKHAIVGYQPHLPYLFPLFDFIFYCRSEKEHDFERLAWQFFRETSWPCEITYGNLLIAQNLLVFNQNIEHMIYFIQRMFIDNYQQLILFYVQRMIKDNESFNRFLFLLYCAFIEMSGNHIYMNMLKYFLDNQRIYLFKQRRDILKFLLQLCQQTPKRLVSLCRQNIRRLIQSSIDEHVRQQMILSKHLQQYLLLEELSNFNQILSSKRIIFLIEKNFFY